MALLLATCAGCGARDADRRAAPAAAMSTGPTSVRQPSDCAGQLVTEDRVGPLRIGGSLDSVRSVCTVLRDTTIQPNIQLPRERLVSILLGHDTAVVTVRRNRVAEVMLTGAGFATADSVGVGTPLRRLIAFPHVNGSLWQGRLYVSTPAKCGTVFVIARGLAGLSDGVRDSAGLSLLPQSLAVDGVRIDGCPRDDEPLAEDDSTFDVQTDTVFLARDLDGNARTDFVVRESRPYRRSIDMHTFRLAMYLDSLPASRRATWATPWDMEGDMALDGAYALSPRASLLVVTGNNADYTSETLLVVRSAAIAVELTHGEDYGEGFLEVRKESGGLMVDASQYHLMLRETPVTPEIECKAGEWPAVRAPFDTTTWRFVPERPRCVKARHE